MWMNTVKTRMCPFQFSEAPYTNGHIMQISLRWKRLFKLQLLLALYWYNIEAVFMHIRLILTGLDLAKSNTMFTNYNNEETIISKYVCLWLGLDWQCFCRKKTSTAVLQQQRVITTRCKCRWNIAGVWLLLLTADTWIKSWNELCQPFGPFHASGITMLLRRRTSHKTPCNKNSFDKF